ncbi:ABC transporter permease, partial [Verrucomicrobiota bacterium]
SGKVVIGGALAKRLDVQLDDDLYVTLAGPDEIRSAMLRIVGILRTGSKDADAAVCHTTWKDVERITGRPGPGEISVLLDDYRRMDPAREELARRIGDANEVITWREVNPSLAANVEGDAAFTKGLVGIIVVVVALGIAGAQLTAVLERRREFAVLSALGMRDRQLVALILFEALIIGFGGAIIALGGGGWAAHYLATKGVNLAALSGDESFSFGDVILDPYMYADFGPWLISYALAVSVVTTVAASVYPAWLATRVDPAEALRS